MSQQIRELLVNPDTYTTTLMMIILDAYGTEALQWNPTTILMELYEDFHVRLPQQNIDQIVVGLNLLTSDDFYTRLSKFIPMCNVLAGGEMSTSFDMADVSECAWGITEAGMLAPEEAEQPFAAEIQHYIGHMLDAEGIKQPPQILAMAIQPSSQQTTNLDGLPTDDPDMLGAAYDIRMDRSQAIEEMLSDNLSRLLQQLAYLPGHAGRVGDLVKDLRRAG